MSPEEMAQLSDELVAFAETLKIMRSAAHEDLSVTLTAEQNKVFVKMLTYMGTTAKARRGDS